MFIPDRLLPVGDKSDGKATEYSLRQDVSGDKHLKPKSALNGRLEVTVIDSARAVDVSPNNSLADAKGQREVSPDLSGKENTTAMYKTIGRTHTPSISAGPVDGANDSNLISSMIENDCCVMEAEDSDVY